MSNWFSDIRQAVRFCLQNPGFTLISTVLLGLGIGVNCAIFGLLNALVLQPLPFPDGERLVWVNTTYLEAGYASVNMSLPDVEDFKQRSPSISALAVSHPASLNLRASDSAQRIQGSLVSKNFFAVFGIQPELGRLFSKEDESDDNPPVVIISRGLLERFYGADPGIIGKAITLNEVARTVVGVVPSFRFMRGVEAWIPIDTEGWAARENRSLNVVGRLNPEFELKSAQSEMSQIAQALAVEYPASNDGRDVRVRTYSEVQVGDLRVILLLVNGVAFLILLIACANVANLLLSRAVERRHEGAIRMALGAGRWRIVRQCLTESLLVATLGAGAGLLLAWMTFRLLVLKLPPELLLQTGELWQPVLIGFAIVLAFVTATVFGSFPALLVAGSDPQLWLRPGVRGASAPADRIRGSFVAVQVAVAVILLSGAGLMVNSLIRMWAVDVGFDVTRLVTMRLDLDGSRYSTSDSRVLFARQLIDNLQALPGVESAAVTTSLPLSGSTTQTSIRRQGEPARSLAESRFAVINRVSSELLLTLGIPLQQGRGISSLDTPNSPAVAGVNRALANRLWGREDPLGQVLVLGREDAREVVGVVADAVHADRIQPEPQIYIPYAQQPVQRIRLMIRASGDPGDVTALVRAGVLQIDPARPIYEVVEMKDVFLRSRAEEGISGVLMSAFALLALTMSALGIYGLIAFWVQQNTREIGVRMALGAGRGGIVRLVLARSFRHVLIGGLVGLLGSIAVGRLLRGMLFEVGAADPISFGAVLLILMATATLAVYLPTRRALRVDPIRALRFE